MLVPTALCPLLLDREHESAVVAAALGSLFSGNGAALTIVGETGIGKTRLAAELARAASERGAIVLRGVAAPDGVNGEPFGVLGSLARSAIAAGASSTVGNAALFRRASVALGLEHVLPDPIPPAENVLPEPVAARALVLELVEQLCRRRPVVVVFEDLHHAMAETHAAAHLLCESVRGAPLLVVATSAAQARVSDLPGTRLDLQPLAAESVHRMIGSCLHGIEIPDQLVASVREHSGGIPLVVEDLLAAAVSEYERRRDPGRVDLVDVRVPESFEASVAVRLNRRVKTRQVIEAAAVLGCTFEWRLVAETIGTAEIDVLNALHMAIGLQLLGPDDGPDSECFTFRSEATRATVLSHLSKATRRDLAASALAALERLHPDLPGTRLTQAANLATLAHRSERATDLWTEAGQRCSVLGAPAEARDCFAAAAMVNRDPSQATRLARRVEMTGKTEGLNQLEVLDRRTSALADAQLTLDAGPLEALRSEAAAAGLARLVAAVDGDLAVIHAWRWDAERAAAAARRQRHLAHRLGLLADPAEQVAVLASECSVFAVSGDRAGLESASHRLEELDAARPFRIRCAESQAMLALVDADVAAALAAFECAAELARTCPTITACPFAWQALLRAACGRAGAEPTDGHENNASGVPPLSVWEQALLNCAAAIDAGRVGDGDRATRCVANGMASFESLGEIGPRYVALWLVSASAATDGWGEPELWSREAARWFEARGYHRLATACRSVLRSTGAKVPRRGRGESKVPSALAGMGLTSREVDVLALVAEGLTNKEIGRRLFISPRTVGNHIANLLAKSGARSRGELRELAIRHGLAER